MREIKLTYMKRRVGSFMNWMLELERGHATIDKYRRDIRFFLDYMQSVGRDYIDKEGCLVYKEVLMEQYKPSSANSMLAALNQYFKFLGHPELVIKPIRIQREIFDSTQKNLEKAEYQTLIRGTRSNGDAKTALIMETICATGIRVSELKYITVKGVQDGQIRVYNKGKVRIIFIPHKLKVKLLYYIQKKNVFRGSIFVTRNGIPMHRSNIWTVMKNAARKCGISEKKVFPHNLRHLFARMYYQNQRDIAKLADLLGHSSIETTRIYIKSTGEEHEKQIAQLGLVL